MLTALTNARVMTRLFMLFALLACLAVPACQCSDKPEIGPVEESSASADMADTAARIAPAAFVA